MADPKIPLEGDRFYHIYNHAVGNELFFKSDENYNFFLRRFKKHVHPYAELYAYCLMSNHFHFVVKVKPEKEVLFAYKYKRELQSKRIVKSNVPDILSQAFSNYFNSYAQAYNKENNRMGSLFVNRFKRIHIDSENYLKRLIIYVHHNPKSAGLVSKIGDWKYSSYNAICSTQKTLVARNEVVELFDNLDNFKAVH